MKKIRRGLFMKKVKLILITVMILISLLISLFTFFAVYAQPGPGKPGYYPPPHKVKFDVNLSLREMLSKLQGREVVVYLDGGNTLQGYIEAVGSRLVHLTHLAGGKDYYDALIRIETINAIEVRARSGN